MYRSLLALGFGAAMASAALAAPVEVDRPPGGVDKSPLDHGQDFVVVDPKPELHLPADVLYLNRCVGGCTVHRGSDDAFADSSSIPDLSTSTLTEFYGDDVMWNEVVACVEETYRPYGITVTTEPPTAGTRHVEVMVAGVPAELCPATGTCRIASNTLGVAPFTSDCSSQSNVIAFAFANGHPASADMALYICSTAAHEAGHTFGLDHAFECKDPMTYLVDCGHKYFLNIAAACGEFDGTRDCRCAATQNSHQKLASELGYGVLPPAPEIEIAVPANGSVVTPSFAVFFYAREPRLVTRVEVHLNGWPWASFVGRRDDGPYIFNAPAELPDGVIDIDVRAWNDLASDSMSRITVTKGSPCTASDTCLAGQSCREGRCAYPEPQGQLGDACAIDGDCASRRCVDDGNHAVCSQPCLAGAAGECPTAMTCVPASSIEAVCWPSAFLEETPGGCCNAGASGGGWILIALTALMLRRRRG